MVIVTIRLPPNSGVLGAGLLCRELFSQLPVAERRPASNIRIHKAYQFHPIENLEATAFRGQEKAKWQSFM
jgi:hypothetical protein